MAILKSKQLSTQLTGSYVLSGSQQTFIGTTQITGSVETTGDLTLKGSSVDLNIRSDDNVNLARLLTTTGGSSGLQLIDNLYHNVATTVDLNSSGTNALTITSGSTTVFNVDRDNFKISGSYSSTGSFGNVLSTGNIESSGRIFESGTSVIDHATAMAIVFGG
tara:strand:+ start:4697 stop:5185 length:489 start_codon:yes stop_codon:yes gene_type:complete